MSDPIHSTLRTRTFDRLKKSIAGEACDGHAVFNYYTFPFFQNVTGVKLDAYFHDPKVTMETQLAVYEQLAKCGSFAPDPGPVAEATGLGGKVRFDRDGFISLQKMRIQTLEEAMALKPGDPYGDNYMRIALECLEYMRDHAPKDYKVNPPICVAPFTICAQLCGISEFCINIIMEPDIVKAMLDVATQTCIRYIKASEKIMGAPLHHVLISDDMSSFVSRDDFAKWVMPTYRAIFAEFPDTQMWLHNDAKAGHLAALIADAGFKAWQHAPVIPSAQAMADCGGRMSLLGGLNPVEMQSVSAQQMYDICVEKLKSFGGNPKFVLGVGGSVNQIPIGNLMAMLRAADEYKI